MIAALGALYLFASWLLERTKNPQISPSELLTSLTILILVLSWYVYRYRKIDKRQFIWLVMLILLLVFAIFWGSVLGFVRGVEVTSTELTPTPTRAPTPTTLPAVDNSTYNFEQGLQGWEMGCSPTGRKLGTGLKRTLEQAFAGSYALKFEQDFEVEAPTIGIGRVESLPQHGGNELIIAYVKIQMDAPTNVGASFFTYCESDRSQNKNVYTDDSESETRLRPGLWNTLVWEVPSDNNTSDIGIGLKFRLVPKEELEWVRGSEFAWEEGVIYIDAVQIIGRSPSGQLVPVTLPSETPAGPTPEATPSPETPTPVALAATPSLPSTPVLTAVVAVEALNLRVGPGMGYEIIRTLKGGETLTLLGRTSNGYWLHVRTSKLEEGWVSASFVDGNKDLATVPTVASTPTRTLLDAPTPLWPLTEDEASFVNQVEFKWKWIRPLAESEYFSVRVSRQDNGEECFHDKIQNTVYSGQLPFCNSGKLLWETVVAKLLSKDPEEWLELSPTSEPQLFDFAKEKPVPPTNTPEPAPPDDDDDGNGGGGEGDGPPPCRKPPC